jgi:hypothetical protein
MQKGALLIKKNSMKVLVFMLVIAASLSWGWAYAQPIPASQLVGKYAVSITGSQSDCFNSTFTALQDCTLSGTNVVAESINGVGQSVADAAGNSCGVQVFTLSPLLGSTFPAVVLTVHAVGTVTSYNARLGSGTGSFKNYQGGICTSASFDATGATLLASGTSTFQASENGNLVVFTTTNVTSNPPPSTIGSAGILTTATRFQPH